MAPAGDMALTREFNDSVLVRHDEQGVWYPVCSVHPADGQAALTEFDRVGARGSRVLKLHPNTQNFDVATKPWRRT